MATATVKCVDLRCEYLVNPIGIDVTRPRLSWILESNRRGIRQSAYHIRVGTTEESLLTGKDLVLDSGEVRSDRSTHVAYEGADFMSGKQYFWQVRILDDREESSSWSDISSWETGLLKKSDWEGDFIEPIESVTKNASRPAPFLRGAFRIEKTVRKARLHISSHGTHELSLNGSVVGNEVFSPGFTSYHDRLQYRTHDISSMLRKGENVVGIVLGDGWFRGKLTIASMQNVYGDTVGAIAQIRIEYTDGSRESFHTDAKWKSSTGPILRSDPKDGEIYNARLEIPGWDVPGFDDSGWHPVRLVDYGSEHLIAYSAEPVRRQEHFKPLRIIRTPKGQTVIDFGQNIAGRTKLRVSGPAGTTVTLRHGESLDQDGNFSITHLQPAIPGVGRLTQEDRYTLRGGGDERYEPRFSVHGFRYVEVLGWPGEISDRDIEAVSLYSDMARTGYFSCSDSRINRLYENIVWSMKGNSLDIPTDCPTRERAGWTGDAQIFAATGSFLMNTAPFLGKWLQDLAADQRSNGMVPNMVPDAGRYRSSIVSEMTEGSAGWGDAAILIPWTLYVTFEDTRILKRQYESMRNWIRYALTQSKKGNVSEKLGHLRNLDAGRLHRQPFIWNNGYHWEEWLAPGERERTSWNITRNVFTNRKSETMVATAYLAHSVGLFATIAGILGREADQVRYTDLYEQMRRAFAEEFLTDGKLDPDEQASYVRALTFDLIPAPFRAAAVDRLAELIVAEGNHLRTGFLSTPFICHVLSGNGLADLAYELLRQDTSPSWLYAIDKGATTIWESWDAIDADGTIHGSLNHVAFGSIGSWLHEVVAGIVPDTDDPGYRHFYLRPIPGGNLTFARATYKSTHGTIASSWSIDGDIMKYDFTVPPNTTATVTIPHANVSQVSEGDTSITQIHEIHSIREDGDGITFEVAAGTYSLTWNWAHPDTPQ